METLRSSAISARSSATSAAVSAGPWGLDAAPGAAASEQLPRRMGRRHRKYIAATDTSKSAAANKVSTSVPRPHHRSAMPPKLVPPFAWGDHPPYASYDLEKFLVVAERVMARRSVALTPAMRRALAGAYERRWTVPA